MEQFYQQQAMEQVSKGILQVAEMEEKKLDAQLKNLENLDEDDFEALRQKRRLMLQKKMKLEQDWKQIGHGRYMEINDPKEFFNAAKKSKWMVVHFYRSVTVRCQIVDAHLEKLCQEHLETRFIKIDAEKSPFLVEKLGIILMPTIVLIKDGKTEHSIHGFDEFGGTDDFTTADMAYVLASRGVLNYDNDRSEEIRNRSTKAGLNSIRLATIRASNYDDMDDSDLFD